MIVVIADDLSGAAELANVSLEAGFSADVQRRFDARSEADVVCVTTDTRSLSEAQAAAAVAGVAREVAIALPSFVYKKCDSLLRGHVAAEARAAARVLGCDRIVLAAANPSRGRTVQGGTYFVGGVPLAATMLAKDPEHPRFSSRMADLLGDSADLEMPDLASAEDVLRLAHSVGPSTLAVGAADFFSALLALRQSPQRARRVDASRTDATLFVCGSLAAWLERGSEPYSRHDIPSLQMPRALHDMDSPAGVLDDWAERSVAALLESRALLLSVGVFDPSGDASSTLLTDRLSHVVALVLERACVARLCIEGGATATAIASRLKLECFHAEPSPGPGVGALRPVGVDNPQLLVKPGSYPWPAAIWSPRGSRSC